MKFSQRIGKTQIKYTVQKDDIDQELRNGLWNIYCDFVFRRAFFQIGMSIAREIIPTDWGKIYFRNLWHDHFKLPMDTMPLDNHERMYGYMRDYFFSAQWFELYDLIEFTAKETEDADFEPSVNAVLERELSAYRLIDHVVTPITDDTEKNIIEETLSITSKFSGVYAHLKSALEKLSEEKSRIIGIQLRNQLVRWKAFANLLQKIQRPNSARH